MSARMPVLFVGHGSPLYAIEDNQWSRGFRSLRDFVPPPRAIMMISAHWYTAGTFVTANERPPTIHDFYGFPQELHEVQYPAPGDPQLARRVRDLLGTVLRDEDVLIIGSGNVTHNLRDLMLRMQTGDSVVPDWARRFDDKLKDILLTRDTNALVKLWPTSDDARRSHPTPDHFLPIIYAYAASDSRDETRFPIEGFDHSASMRAVLFRSS